MNRLIFDYFRRWWWLLASGGAFQFKIGWSISAKADYPFEFWVFMVALWMGARLLNFDLQRGVARTVVSLPLTARQIGRSWWVATIPIPAVVLAGLLFLGAWAFHCFHPANLFPAERLGLASLFVLPWLGTTFTSIYGLNQDIFGTPQQRISTMFFSWLSVILLFGGMLTLQNASKQPLKFCLYMGLGALLIWAGWFRAERFVIGRASFRLPAGRQKNPLAGVRLPGGYGGIPFLISVTFSRAFLMGLAIAGLMVLMTAWEGLGVSRQQSIAMLAMMGSFMTCWFFVIFHLIQLVRQLRFLRTLPISPTRLAAVMILLAILPLVALGILLAAVAWPAVGSAASVAVLKSYIYILAPAAVCAIFVVWLGAATQTYLWTYLILFGFLMAPLWLRRHLFFPEITFSQTAGFVAACVLPAFLLVRRSLMRSSRAYRIFPGGQANPFGGLGWGLGK